MNLADEFKRRCQKIDKIQDYLYTKKLYNIHKRSLPIGIDVIVIYRVTKDEGNVLCNRILRPKCYECNEVKTLIYYDLIPIDATPKERSIYYNGPKIVIGGLDEI